jgi:hypothetical protein
MTKLNVIDQNTGKLVELDIGEVNISGITVPTNSPIVGQVTISGGATQFSSESIELTGASVLIRANDDNSQAVALGGSDVEDAVDGTGNGFVLPAGKTIILVVDDINKLYVNGQDDDWISYAGS